MGGEDARVEEEEGDLGNSDGGDIEELLYIKNLVGLVAFNCLEGRQVIHGEV